jgi:hypothetical protein
VLLKAVGQPLGTTKGIGRPLGNDQRLTGSPWAILKGYREAAGKCPNTNHQPIGKEAAFPGGYAFKSYHF